MEGPSSQEDLTTRSLLRGILATEPVRSAVKQKHKRRTTETESLLQSSSSGSPQKHGRYSSVSTPSMSLRSKMKQKVRQSLGKQASKHSPRKSVSRTHSLSKKNPVRRAHPLLADLDKVTPRMLLRKIMQAEPEVSMIVSQKTEMTESKDTEQEIPNDNSQHSVGNIDLSLPELQEDERVPTFGNARKKFRISITQFEQGVEERLPQTQESSSSKLVEESGNLSALYRSSFELLRSPEPEIFQKRGLVRRPKKQRLISLMDFEKGVNQNYQLLKGSQECFIESITEDDSSASDTTPVEQSRNTLLYDLPVSKERSHTSNTQQDEADQQVHGDGREEEQMEVADDVQELPKNQSLQTSSRLQDREKDGSPSAKTQDEEIKADGNEQPIPVERNHLMSEVLEEPRHEEEQSAELIDVDTEVVMGTPEKNTSQINADAVLVSKMSASRGKDPGSALFESSQGPSITLPLTQNLTDSVFSRLSKGGSAQKPRARSSTSIKQPVLVSARNTSGSESGNDLDDGAALGDISEHHPAVQTTPQSNMKDAHPSPRESTSHMERRLKSSSASVTNRMSVQHPRSEEQTAEESVNEGEEQEASESEALGASTSHTERRLKSASALVTKRMSIQRSQIEKQAMEESGDRSKSEEPRISISHKDIHLKSASASVTKRRSIQPRQSQEAKEKMEQSDNEEEPESEDRGMSTSPTARRLSSAFPSVSKSVRYPQSEEAKGQELPKEELPNTSQAEPRASTSLSQRPLTSTSITKRMSAQHSQRGETTKQTAEKSNYEEDILENIEAPASSWTETQTPTSQTLRRLKSTTITKWMSIQRTPVEEPKEQSMDESDDEEETEGEESEKKELSEEEKQKSPTKLLLTPLPDTPAYLKRPVLNPPVGDHIFIVFIEG
ncbi:centromere protein T isoform 2-T2 [Discoglossus pictus]